MNIPKNLLPQQWMLIKISSYLLLATLSLTLLIACQKNQPPQLSREAALGERAFNDPSLSASGRQSCASCHAVEQGHGAPNALAVQPGGPQLEARGLRTAQALRYLKTNTRFHFDADGKASGGFFWDGRADTLAAQAAGPLLGAREMANINAATITQKIAQAAWVNEFKTLYGANILNDSNLALAKLNQALERYQLEDAQFNGFTSKYDAVLRKAATLSAQEQRGLDLFNDPQKGNCAACHTSTKNPDGSHPLFTDFSYDNLGLPRNPDINENANPHYFDLGLCDRPDLKHRKDLCGAFRVPSLRNVSLRRALFHNGHFKTLEEAMHFYVERNTHPEKWYPKRSDGTVNQFNDLPLELRNNVNTKEVPYDRKRGDNPALNASEIEDVIAFLHTLNDGWNSNSKR